MKKLIVIGICLFALVGTFALLRHKKPVQAVSVAQKSIVEDCSVTDEGVILAVNKYRAELGVKPLVFNEKLDGYANQRASYQNGVLDEHAGLVGASKELGYYQVGEDQSHWTGCHNSDTRVYGFKSSERHWTSLMNPRYSEIGVGFYKDVLNINLGDLTP